MAHQGIPIVCGGLMLLLGLTPFSVNGQTTANPTPPEQQGVAEQPAVVPSDRADLSTVKSERTQDPASDDRQVAGAVTHVWKAELAGNEGNIPEMLRQSSLSLEQAKAAQRAGTNPDLNDGIMDLNETLRVGQRDQIAPSALRDARIKLSRAATIQKVATSGTSSTLSSRTVTGELKRSSTESTVQGQETYVVRDRQSGDTPVLLSTDMSRQIKEGDIVTAQIDSQGRVVAISKSPE
jgi:hypothetical protein